MEKLLLNVNNIGISLDNEKLLHDISFDLQCGETLGVIGANGVGKSLVVKILTGMLAPTEGEGYLQGKEIPFGNAEAIRAQGVAVLYQWINLAENLSIAENIMLGHMPKGRFGKLNWKEIYKKADEYLYLLGYNMDSRKLVQDLEHSEKRVVELAKAMMGDVRLLILDEPYMGMTEQEQISLKRMLEKLKEKGIGIIMISHQYDMVRYFCDSVLIMNQGTNQKKIDIKSVTEDLILQQISDKEHGNVYPKFDIDAGEELLKLDDVSSDTLKHVSFCLKRHEICGIYGLVNSGKYNLTRALAGFEKINEGEIRINGKAVSLSSPMKAMHAGIGYLPEISDVLDDLYMNFSLRDNVAIPDLAGESGYKKYSADMSKTQAEKVCRMLRIDGLKGMDTPVQNLSGGNQQKTRLARRLFSENQILILEEPTQGIDIASRVDLYNYICKFVLNKSGVIFVSSDINELMGLCDRILLMCDGRITGEVSKHDFSELPRLVNYA